MQEDLTVWNAIFARQGIVFSQPHDDIAQFAELLTQHGAHKLLDLGCGTRQHVLFFSERGLTVYGIDNATAGLHTTQQRLDQAGLTAHLVRHDVFDDLPFENAFFDTIVSIQVIHYARLTKIYSLSRR